MIDLPVVQLAAPGTQPDFCFPPYVATIARSPRMPLIVLPETLTEKTGPVFGHNLISKNDSDLTTQHGGEALGERIVVHGRVLDEDGRPVRGALIEVWQANAAGRYRHKVDGYDAPLDPNFSGGGRLLTDTDGRYFFKSHPNRQAHIPGAITSQRVAPFFSIHFSLFGAGILSRLVTQMYFPGDPLQPIDPIFNSIPDEAARQRLVSRLDMERSQSNYALAYEFNIVLRGSQETVFESAQ